MRPMIYVAKAILNLIYAIMKLFPVKNKITILSRQADTPSLDIIMLAEEIERISPETQVVCLCKTLNRGMRCKIRYAFHILKQMKHISTSRAVVIDSYCIGVSFFKQRKSLNVIQIWHALGALKKFGKSIIENGGEGRSEKLSKAMNMHGNYTCILASSEKCIGPYSEAFGYEPSNIKIGSLPRVDALMSDDFKEKVIKKIDIKYPELVSAKGNKKIVVYAPTFRKGEDISRQIENLANALNQDEYTLVIKKHPLMEISDNLMGTTVDNMFSTMEMLVIADYVVCDYSAVVYEAALLEKPLFFYCFDLDEYTSNRDFYLNYTEDMPGPIGKNGTEIANLINGEQFDIDRVKSFAKAYVSVQKSCTRELAKLITS